MNINYDKEADAVYLKVGMGAVARTVKMEDRLMVDIDQSDNIVGIEILYASSQTNLIEFLQNNAKTGVPIEIVDHALKHESIAVY